MRKQPRHGAGGEAHAFLGRLRAPCRVRRAAALLVLLAACDRATPLMERLAPETPHEGYAERLRDAGLDATALGRAWLAAADSAVAHPVPVELPFRTAGYFAGDEARAVALAVRLRHGQRLVAEVARQGDSTAMLFVDLFVVPRDTLDDLERVASADSTLAPLEVTARRDAVYVLRLQPELLRGLRYEVTLRATASLAVFPVAGRSTSAVRSGFGAARDGGAREHHGIDIFAPRGTPALAATDGYVRSTTPSRLGGNLVWLRDDHARQSLYYAHLDTVLVVPGQRVRAGDTLGLVGNTGNARTTPPHLHFGIYARGPVDPFPFVYVPRARPREITATLAALGEGRRTASRASFRAALDDDTGARLEVGTPLRVLGAAGASYFVRLPDGRAGWVSARATEPLDGALRRRQLAAGTVLRAAPRVAAVVVDSLAAPREAVVVGRFGGFALVREGERTGWVLETGE
ncbi:MAG TPA: peptidoglycan DD-metalloendopeptidase family protein [Gemmatimonadaceae bacterium]|nr:peptidoglycan DD-metalloendopeptidase family protein [Gemmatimonadaceae bacterium]